ncbi:YbaN family protein [Peribacillus frigoritolerans]|uniref:YbaN family protein n=1 Tax=Peribacillus frigoritolerans TaxID=450367 RepID=UPI0022091E4D|nr:YbaN family protein [Peribacillus frigoritolerans]USK74125.1 YbaN family protein [Peribacillus frigoritolerans]
MTIKKVKSILFFLLGAISLLIGIAGTVLPVLPGGPFYLFAAFCFAKSSKSIENWFKSTSLYEKYVEAFLQKKGMTRREKIRINLIADFFIVISVFYVDILLVKILLVGLALYKHYYFIKKIKTIDRNGKEKRAF